jgi:hypothetical protein
MAISFKVWIGFFVIGLGLAGLVYTMQIVSKAAASKGLVYKEDVPKYPDNMKVYIPMEAASAAIMTIGIVIAALGHADTVVKVDTLPQEDVERIKDSTSKVAGAA